MKLSFMKKLIMVVVIFALIISDFLMVGISIANAIYAELETQKTEISNTNIEFDMYFKDGVNKPHYKELNISEENMIYLNVKISDSGVLNDGKIKIDNPNFKIKKNEVNNSYVKDINEDTNEIYLNQIIYGNNVEIEIPIVFEKQNNMNTQYFNTEFEAILEGKYKSLEKETSIKGSVKARGIWTENVDIELSQSIDKYIVLENDKTLLQQKILANVIDNKLPIENMELIVNVPVIDEVVPEVVAILNNGVKLNSSDYEYKKEEGNLVINKTRIKEERETLNWGTGTEEFKVIYNYEGIGEIDRNISLDTDLNIKMYTKEEVTKSNNITGGISKIGEVVSANKAITKESYKGYLYYNSGEETNYSQITEVEVSNIDTISEFELNTQNDNFVTDENIKYNVNDSTYYKSIQIDIQELIKILGENGYITIKDEEGNVIATINKDNQTNEEGRIEVEINNKSKLGIVFSKPEQEGSIRIYEKKAISSNTGHDKNILKRVTRLESNSSIKTDKSESQVVSYMNLLDTKTEATIKLNNINLSTLEKNNVQISVLLKTSSNTNDLFKNPTIRIELPEEIKEIEINQINRLYVDENQMTLTEGILFEENGKKILQFKLEGEQLKYSDEISKGIELLVNADITLDKETPTKMSEIKMIYTNENGNEVQYEESIEVDFTSKYGVLVYNSLSGYNGQNEVLENISDSVAEGKIDINTEGRIASQDITVVNNYENEIQDLTVVGRIPTEDEMVDSNVTFELVEAIETNIGAKVYYSTNVMAKAEDDSWTEDILNARAYKVVVDSLNVSEVLKISYKLQIPEGIKYNSKAELNTEVSYNRNGQTANTVSKLLLKSEEVKIGTFQNNVGKTDVLDGITTNIVATSEGRILSEGTKVNEGQVIKYTVTVTNNKDEDIENLVLRANHTNAIYWGYQYLEAIGGTEETIYNVYVRELPELTEKELTVDVLKAGDSVVLEYQISIKEVDSIGEKNSGEIEIIADNLSKQTVNTYENGIEEAELKLVVYSGKSEDFPIIGNDWMGTYVVVRNISNKNLENVVIEYVLDDMTYFDINDVMENEKYELIEYDEDNNIVRFKIYEIKQLEEVNVVVVVNTNAVDKKLAEDVFNVFAVGHTENNSYNSNILTQVVTQIETGVEIIQTGSIEGETVEEGEKIVFTTNIKNTGVLESDIRIYNNVQQDITIDRVYYIYNGVQREVSNYQNNRIEIESELNTGDEIEFVVEVTILGEKLISNDIVNVVNISGFSQMLSSNVVRYRYIHPEDIEEPIITEPEDPTDVEDKTYTISGTTWIDVDRNGSRESTEKILNDITVNLIDVVTGEIVKTTKVSNDNYRFEEIEEGKYYIAFEYDVDKYRIAEYQKSGVDGSVNSDITNKEITLNGITKVYGITDILEVNRDISNIDAGFIENEIFDLSLSKYINRITIQNTAGTTVREYNNTQLAKVEIHSRNMANSTVLIEYQIEVKNEGELAGYVSEIVDYMPNDLRFSSELNKDWHMSTDGYLYNSSLANQKLEPGSTRTVSLILIKTMTANNTGLVVNTAEIQKANNDLSIKDIDSTPGNRVQGEDDMSTAEVIISISTGMEMTITILIIVLLIIIGIGIIYKFRRKEENNEY